MTQEETTPVDPHEALIEEIRREEFGINVELSEDGRKLMNKQKERLGRSLDRLSKVGTFGSGHVHVASLVLNNSLQFLLFNDQRPQQLLWHFLSSGAFAQSVSFNRICTTKTRTSCSS